jgi:predicted amidohydrolase YtcJ
VLLIAAGVLVVGALYAGVLQAAPARATAADTVYTNGVVYTVDAARSTAQAVAVKDGHIVYVGDNAGAAAFVGAGTASVDLGGRFMMPGFIDSHMHPSYAYQEIYEVSLYGLRTMKAYQRAVKAFAAKHPVSEIAVLRGNGWSNTLVPGRGPTKQQLDKVVKDRPAVMWSEDGHSMWCNTAMLKFAGVTAKTADPPGGVIERVKGSKVPSGTLRDAATAIVEKKLPDYPAKIFEDGLKYFDETYAGPLGMTTVFDAELKVGENKLQAFEDLAQGGALSARFRAALWIDPDFGPLADQIQKAVAERSKHTTDLFQTPDAKLFVDGVVEGHTALLTAPYLTKPKTTGTAIWPYAELQAASIAAAQAGFQLHYHAIGDAASSTALNAIAAAEKAAPMNTWRPGITHLQLVTPTDYQRMAQLNVTAAPQPYWFVKDSYYWDLQLPYLGKWRADREYPMKSFFDSGVLVASGSDYPVTYPPDPLDAIQTGVMRWFQGPYEWAKTGDVLWPAQRVTVLQMIDSFTINGAVQLKLEAETGSIEVGKSADMIVLDRNLLTVPPKQIGKGRVLLTVFKGKAVFAQAPFARTATD